MRIKLKYLIPIIIIMFIVNKCQSISKEYFLSNPTDKEIKLVLNSKEYNLKPQSFEKVKLKAGKHNLKTHEGENINFIVYYDSTGGVINPTKDSYIILKEVYGSEVGEGGRILRESNIKFGDIQFKAVSKVSNRIIIDKNLYEWDYNLGEELPEKVYVSKNTKHDSKAKIYTRKELLDYFEKISEKKFPADVASILLNEKITVDDEEDTYGKTLRLYENEFTVPNYNTPGLKEIVQKMVDVKNKYGVATKSGQQKKLKKEMEKLIKKMDELNKIYVEKDSGKNVYYSPYLYMKQGTIVTK